MAVEPSAPETVTPAQNGANWKMNAYLVGAVIGILLGLLSAYLYVRATEENGKQTGAPGRIKTGDAMKLTLSIITLVRQIAELGGKA